MPIVEGDSGYSASEAVPLKTTRCMSERGSAKTEVCFPRQNLRVLSPTLANPLLTKLRLLALSLQACSVQRRSVGQLAEEPDLAKLVLRVGLGP